MNSLMSKRSVHELTCEDALKKRAKGPSIPIIHKHLPMLFWNHTCSEFLHSSLPWEYQATEGKCSIVVMLWKRDLGAGNGTPLQYSCLESPMDGGAWWATVHGVAKSRTRLSNFPFTFHFNALEKEMATHSNVLAWRIPGTGEPGGLPSMGSHGVGHNWSDLAAAAAVNQLCFIKK